jgi:hypothetical protein
VSDVHVVDALGGEAGSDLLTVFLDVEDEWEKALYA